jgi:hypothetical protein
MGMGEMLIGGVVWLITMLLVGVLWLSSLILVLVLPKTWWGKALALLLASGFIFIDRMVIEQWDTSGLKHLFNLPIFHFFVLFFVVAAIACRKESEGQASLVLLFIAGLFVLFPFGIPQLRVIIQENNQKAEQAKWQAEQAEQAKFKAEQDRQKTEWEAGREARAAKQEVDWAQTKEMYEEFCKQSGEFIYHTMDNVDGLLFNEKSLPDEGGALFENYRYIDEIGEFGDDRKNSMQYRRFAVNTRNPDACHFNLRSNNTRVCSKNWKDKTFVPDPVPRYAVTKKERVEKKIGDSKIRSYSTKITDLQTNEVMGEYIAYSAWRTHSLWRGFSDFLECPPLSEPNAKAVEFSEADAKTVALIFKVLKPRQLGVKRTAILE